MKKSEKTDRRERAEEEASDLIWGINAVSEALGQQAKAISEVLVLKGKAGPRIQQIVDGARTQGVRLRFVEQNRLGVPRNCHHQGVVARLAATALSSLEELLAAVGGDSESGARPARILVLDSIQDPRNLGSILRSALAAGFAHIILTRERSAPVTGTVARTSAGAVSHLQLCQVVNLVDALQKLKDQGFWIYGGVAESEQALSMYSVDFSGPICLVVGSEGKGIRPLVRKQCDQLVTIPMEGGFNSLNASVAAALLMFEVQRQALSR